MFCGAILFNQPLFRWNVGNIHDFSHMFALALTFRQYLGTWEINANANRTGMLYQTLSLLTHGQPQSAHEVVRFLYLAAYCILHSMLEID
jgi:hypothetical protein